MLLIISPPLRRDKCAQLCGNVRNADGKWIHKYKSHVLCSLSCCGLIYSARVEAHAHQPARATALHNSSLPTLGRLVAAGLRLSGRTTIVLIYGASALLTGHVACTRRTNSAFHLSNVRSPGPSEMTEASAKPNPNRQYTANVVQARTHTRTLQMKCGVCTGYIAFSRHASGIAGSQEIFTR